MAQEDHGPLPFILGLLTAVTGFVDAVTYLKFGHVFVANMTGNLVFMGFGLAGAHETNVVTCVHALLAFLAGTLIGGFIIRGIGQHRGRLVISTTLLKVGLLLLATGLAFFGAFEIAIVPALAIVMGLQNSLARSLAIPDITTTVITLTLTGLVIDSKLLGGSGVRRWRRLSAILTMFAGGFGGGFLVVHAGVGPALAVATLLTATASVTAYVSSRNEPPWVLRPS